MKVVILGAGNLATHLSLALLDAGYNILQIFSRTTSSAAALSETLSVPFTINPEEINQYADIYFYAVSDDALPSLISLELAPAAIHVHTAGSVSMDVFTGKKEHYGVFYPLQTFSKKKLVDFRSIPVFLEASDSGVLVLLENITINIAGQAYNINSSQRLKLHVAAIFASNFVNHLYHIASDLVQESDCSFEILKPLIIETADKVKYMHPHEAQTGPAKRNDSSVIDKHLEALSESRDLVELYSKLSQMILDKQLH